MSNPPKGRCSKLRTKCVMVAIRKGTEEKEEKERGASHSERLTRPRSWTRRHRRRCRTKLLGTKPAQNENQLGCLAVPLRARNRKATRGHAPWVLGGTCWPTTIHPGAAWRLAPKATQSGFLEARAGLTTYKPHRTRWSQPWPRIARTFPCRSVYSFRPCK